MKKFVSVILFMAVLFSLFSGVSFAAATNAPTITPKLYLNNNLMDSSVNPPLLVNGTTYVPIRIVAEQMGFEVIWDQASQTVGIHNATTMIALVINSMTAEVNDEKKPLVGAAQIFNDTTYNNVTMVPLRFVSENMGLQVYYESSSQSVFVNDPNAAPSDGTSSDPVDNPNPDAGPNSGNGAVTLPDGSTAVISSIQYDGLGTTTILFDGIINAITPSVLTGPDRIVVDLPRTAFAAGFTPGFINANSQLGELAISNHPTLTKIRFSNYPGNPIRMVWDLTAASQYSITQDDHSIQLKVLDSINPVPPVSTPTVPTAPAPTTPTPPTPPATTPNVPAESTTPGGSKVFTVIIDPGHGGKDSGAVGITGYQEKVYNLALGLKVKALLDKEDRIQPIMTRADDTFIELDDRAAFANNRKADLFVSLHANKFDSSTATGTETYYYSPQSKTLAEIVHRYVLKATGLKDRGVKTAGYVVIKKTTMPSILIESGFLSNKTEEALLRSEAKQQQIAQAIVAGIKEYLHIT